MNDHDLSILQALDKLGTPTYGTKVTVPSEEIPVQKRLEGLYRQIYMGKFSAWPICRIAVRHNTMDTKLLHFIAWDFCHEPTIGGSLKKLIERFKIECKNNSIIYVSPALLQEDKHDALLGHKFVSSCITDLDDAIADTPCMEFYLKRSEMTQIRNDLLKAIDEALTAK